MLGFTLILSTFCIVNAYFSPKILIDQFIFAIEPWLKEAVRLDDFSFPCAYGKVECNINCTQGKGENLESLKKIGKAVKFVTEGKMFINATLTFDDFCFKYDYCEIKGKPNASEIVSGCLEKSDVHLSIFVEDDISGCQAIVKTISTENAGHLEKPEGLLNSSTTGFTVDQDNLIKNISSILKNSINKSFSTLIGENFHLPSQCS